MNRNRWLLLVVALLLLGNFVYHYWLHRGLITIHSKADPLSKVIHQIERQGNVTVKTNIDGATPIAMWVTDVTVADALKTLSAVTESRWRLAYFVAPDKTAIKGAINSIVASQKPEGWKSVYYPIRGGLIDDEQDVPVDPRNDPWNVKPAKEPTAQAYLEQAARSVAANFLFPENWNPPVKSAPKAGPIDSSLPRLASAAKGKYEEVFLLQKRTRGNGRDRQGGDDSPRFASNDDEGGRPFFGGGGGFNREAMQERMQAELEKLPADRRAEVQKEMDDRRAFFESLRDLPKDQRDAKLAEMMSNPAIQDKMDAAQAAREARNSPQQRASKANNYLARKAAATGGAKP